MTQEAMTKIRECSIFTQSYPILTSVSLLSVKTKRSHDRFITIVNLRVFAPSKTHTHRIIDLTFPPPHLFHKIPTPIRLADTILI